MTDRIYFFAVWLGSDCGAVVLLLRFVNAHMLQDVHTVSQSDFHLLDHVCQGSSIPGLSEGQ